MANGWANMRVIFYHRGVSPNPKMIDLDALVAGLELG